jgi:hypothetical protein
MTGERQPYERPEDVRDHKDERADGRPTGPRDDDGLRPGQEPATAPTEAVEEQGDQPSTEHAPGGDL